MLPAIISEIDGRKVSFDGRRYHTSVSNVKILVSEHLTEPLAICSCHAAGGIVGQ